RGRGPRRPPGAGGGRHRPRARRGARPRRDRHGARDRQRGRRPDRGCTMIAGSPDPVAGPHDPPQAGVWNIANALTLVRIALVPVFVWLLFLDTAGWRLAALAVFAVASLTDKIDGDIARARGLVTDFGKI